jgi:hypothetical protein
MLPHLSRFILQAKKQTPKDVLKDKKGQVLGEKYQNFSHIKAPCNISMI